MSEPARPRVYVSSTFADLREHRAEVRLALQRLGLEDVAMETYTAGETRPLDRCLTDVRNADLYVGILAWRYGFVPDGDQKSITEQEYEEAGRAGIPRLMFVLHDGAPWPPAMMDLGDITPIADFRKRARDARVCDHFTSVGELRGQVAEAVTRWLRDNDAATPETDGAAEWDAYGARLIQQYRRLDLEALTPPDRDEHLQIALRDVFVEPELREEIPTAELPKEIQRKLETAAEGDGTDLPRGLDRALLEQRRESHRTRPARAAFEALAAPVSRTSVVLGDPGAGKSTLARYLVLALAEGRVEGPLRQLADWRPVLVELRDYALNSAEYETFPAYLDFLKRTEGLGVDEEVAEAFLRDDGRALVLFDGLDEVFDPRLRQAISRRIAGFAARYPKVRVIVTSRSVGYRPRVLDDAGFTHYSVQDLSPSKIDTFLSSWYALALSDRPTVAHTRRERLGRAIKESAPIRELAGNPLLLTILAIIGKHQELPRERWKVYDHAASVLVQHWDVNKHLVDQDIEALALREDDKKDLLRRLAIRMQEGSHGAAGNNLTEPDLLDEINAYLRERFRYDPATADRIADAMVRQLRERNFIFARYGPRVYGFVHRALLDFFTAGEIVTRFEKSRRLTEDDLISQVFGERAEDPSWAEVLRLIAGMVDATVAGRIVDSLLASPGSYRSSALDRRSTAAVALAAQCVAEIRNVNAAAGPAERTLEAIIDLLRAPSRSTTGDFRLGVLERTLVPAMSAVSVWPGRERMLEWFVSQGRLTVAPASQIAARLIAAMYPGDTDVRDLLLRDVRSGISEQREAALQGLCHSWKQDDGTRKVLAAALYDPAPPVRRTALDLLMTHWPTDATTRTAMDHAVSDQDAAVRQTALEGLARHAQTDPETLRRLAAAAASDAAAEVRSAAVTTFASTWPDREETSVLLRRACGDPAWSVRETALRTLVSQYAPDAPALAMVREGLRDYDEDVRRTAVDLLASRWTEQPGTREAVHRAARDAHATVRKTAVTVAVLRWPDHPDTIRLLDQASRDPDGEVRVTALTAHSDPVATPGDYAALLHEVATGDLEPGTRRAALRRLVTELPEFCEPTVRRALRDPNQMVRTEAIGTLRTAVHRMPWLLDDVLPLCADPDDTARQAAVEVTARFRRDDPSVKEILVRAPRSRSQRLPLIGLESLLSLWPDDPVSAAALAAGLRDPDDVVRHAAFQISLMAAAGPRERDALLAGAWVDPGPQVRSTAASLLHAITPPPVDGTAPGTQRRVALDSRLLETDAEALAPLLRAGCADPDRGVRLAAYSGLALHRDRIEGVADDMVAACHDTAGEVRRLGLAQLLAAWPDDPRTHAQRRRCLRDGWDTVRALAVESTLLTSGSSAFPTAARVSRDFDWGIRRLGMTVLCRRHGDEPRTRRHLMLTLRFPVADIRQAATSALHARWPDDPGTGAAIRRQCADPVPFVRTSALLLVASSYPADLATPTAALDDPDTAVARTAWHLVHPGRPPSAVPGGCDPSRDPDALFRLLGLEQAVLDDPDTDRARTAVARGLCDEDSAVRSAAFGALATLRAGDDVLSTWLTSLSRHPNYDVRAPAISARSRLLATHEGTVRELPDRFLDIDYAVRQRVVDAVIELRPHTSQARELACRAAADVNWNVRLAGIRLLSVHWPDHPETPGLLSRASRDEDSDVREAGLRALLIGRYAEAGPATRRGCLDPHSVPRRLAQRVVETRPLDDGDREPVGPAPSPAVARARRTAELMSIQDSGTEDPGARDTVLAATCDADWFTRWLGLVTFLQRWSDDPAAERLLERAQHDPNEYVRRLAYHQLVLLHPGTPATLAALANAAADPEQFVRQGAVSWINLWVGDETAYDLLLAAANDVTADVRGDAVKALATSWPADARTRAAVLRGGCSSLDSVRGLAARRISVELRHLGREALLAEATRDETGATVVLAARWADDRAVAEHLTRCSTSPDHATRAAALQGLVFGRTATGEPWEPALRDACPGMRTVAFDAFWQSQRFVPEIFAAALRDTDPDIRLQALTAHAVFDRSVTPPAVLIDQLRRVTDASAAWWVFGITAAQAVWGRWTVAELVGAAEAAPTMDATQMCWLEWLTGA